MKRKKKRTNRTISAEQQARRQAGRAAAARRRIRVAKAEAVEKSLNIYHPKKSKIQRELDSVKRTGK